MVKVEVNIKQLLQNFLCSAPFCDLTSSLPILGTTALQQEHHQFHNSIRTLSLGFFFVKTFWLMGQKEVQFVGMHGPEGLLSVFTITCISVWQTYLPLPPENDANFSVLCVLIKQ